MFKRYALDGLPIDYIAITLLKKLAYRNLISSRLVLSVAASGQYDIQPLKVISLAERLLLDIDKLLLQTQKQTKNIKELYLQMVKSTIDILSLSALLRLLYNSLIGDNNGK